MSSPGKRQTASADHVGEADDRRGRADPDPAAWHRSGLGRTLQIFHGGLLHRTVLTASTSAPTDIGGAFRSPGPPSPISALS